jgi:hypothetical protein
VTASSSHNIEIGDFLDSWAGETGLIKRKYSGKCVVACSTRGGLYTIGKYGHD